VSAGPRTAAPRAPRPRPRIPPSTAELPVDGRKNLVSASTAPDAPVEGAGLVFLEDVLLPEVDPPNLSWQKKGLTREVRMTRER